MTNSRANVPVLDFGSWVIPFPDRGLYAFLSSEDLQTLRSAEPAATEPGMWLLRPASGVGVIIPVDVAIARDGVPVVDLAVLHHGEVLEFADHQATFREVQKIVIAAGSRLAGRKCPLCHGLLAEGQDAVRCPLCGEGYCTDCWAQLSGSRCCSRDCRFSPGAIATEAAS